jgi:hypothetical protein
MQPLGGEMLEIWELIIGRKQHNIEKMEETSCGSQDPTRVVAQLIMNFTYTGC